MKITTRISVLLLAFAPLGIVAQTLHPALVSAVGKMDDCAVPCLEKVLAATPCALTNLTCVCSDETLNANAEACVLVSCTLKQALVITKRITTATCHAPVRSKQRTLKVTNTVLAVLSAFCVIARLAFKAAFSSAEVGWDDYAVLATLLIGLPSAVIQDVGTIKHGLGKDTWTLSFDTITSFVRWFFIMETFYFLNLAMIKLTLLFFFLRIFPAREVRRLLWATIAFDVLMGTAFVLVAIFQCQPISYYWNKWDGENLHGHCINVNAVSWANAIIGIVLDIWMLALPLWQVSKLNLGLRKKIGVALMFCVGTFVTIISIIRLRSLIIFSTSTNPTWDQAEAALWSTIEINVGLICACMPALRLIFVRLFPRARTESADSKYYAKYGVKRSDAVKSGSGEGTTASGSRLGHDEPFGAGKNAITFTKTFEVKHGDDEEHLVPMQDLSPKDPRARSSASSNASGSEPDTPVIAEAPRRPA